MISPQSSFRPRLSLFTPDDLQDTGEASPFDSGVSPRMRLSEFFEQWFLPIVLAAERECSESTVTLYRESIAWWIRLTGDPPLSQIDEFTLALLQEGLRKATFRRGLSGREYPLSRGSQAKHLRNLRAILHRTGPTRDPNRPAKEVLAKTPHLRVPEVKTMLKACFTLDQAKAIVAAAAQMTRPVVGVIGMPTLQWWRSRLGLLFYTGLRTGTIKRLTWQQIVEDEQGYYWLDVPAHMVPKTQKATRVILHPSVYRALFENRRTSSPAEPLSLTPHCNRWMQSLHDELQSKAGLPAAKRLSQHAWRRTHADQLASLGAKGMEEVCRNSMDHASARTTTGHYVDLLNKFRLQLPNLW